MLLHLRADLRKRLPFQVAAARRIGLTTYQIELTPVVEVTQHLPVDIAVIDDEEFASGFALPIGDARAPEERRCNESDCIPVKRSCQAKDRLRGIDGQGRCGRGAEGDSQ